MTEEQDFGAILEAFERGQAAGGGRDPEPGEKVSGRVISVGREATFVDLGSKSEGMVATAELLGDDGEPTVAAGDELEALVTGRDPESGCLILRVRPGRGEAAAAEIAQAHEHGIPVEGVVREVVKGGVEVEVAGLRSFCPISQLEIGYVEDAASYVGQRLSFRITRYEPAGRGGRPNVVLSRWALLEEERRRRAEATRERLAEGAVMKGRVSSLTSYGAFVDLGGLEGLLHVSEISHERLEDPKEVLAEGQEVEVKVLKIEPRKNKRGELEERISLSRKALERDPWQEAAARHPRGERLTGRVTRLEPYGAFVRLAPGLEGLVHVSELGLDRPVRDAREVVELGQELTVEVLDVDTERRRISLRRVVAEGERLSLGDAVYRSPGAGGFGTLGDAFDKLDEE